MNILFSCDSHYVYPLSVCMTSVFENNKMNNVCVYLLHSGLSNTEEKVLLDLAAQYRQTIHLIYVDAHYFADAPALRWSKETYYRLLINELLPSDCARLLYLDVDIIVNKPLGDLYDMDLEGHCIAALHEKGDDQMMRLRLGLSANGFYYQSGVLLFDVQKTKNILSYEKSMGIIRDLGANLIAVDQDVINVMFDGKIKAIDKKFNNMEITRFHDSGWQRLFNRTNKKEIESTCIFHYALSKPWNNLFSGSCEDLWYHYLALSPYKDLYEKKFNTFTYKLLRTGLVKTLFYAYIDITPFVNNLSQKVFSPRLYSNLKQFYRRHIK